MPYAYNIALKNTVCTSFTDSPTHYIPSGCNMVAFSLYIPLAGGIVVVFSPADHEPTFVHLCEVLYKQPGISLRQHRLILCVKYRKLKLSPAFSRPLSELLISLRGCAHNLTRGWTICKNKKIKIFYNI